MWARISIFILKFRVYLLILFAAITVFLGYKAKDIEISYVGGKVLPLTDSSYADYNEFKRIFGEDGNIMVIGLQSDQLFNKKIFCDWYTLSEKIKTFEGVSEVLSISRMYDVVKDTSLHVFKLKKVVSSIPVSQKEVDSLRNVIYNLPFYEGKLINKKNGSTLMAITFERSKLNSQKRYELVKLIASEGKKFESDTKVKLHYSGLPYIRSIISKKLSNEFQIFLGLAIFIAAFILFLFFKNFAAVFYPILVVIIGVIWSLGTIVLFGYNVTILSGLIPPLIVVIGIPNSVLLLNKYHSNYIKTGDKLRSLMNMIKRVGMTTFIANLTTAIGFGVFFFTQSEILTEFGIIASLNIMATYAISLILIPIVFSYLPPPSAKHTKHLENKIIHAIIHKVDKWVHDYRSRIYWVTLVIVLISAYGIYKININGFVVDDVPKNDPISTDLKFFEKNFKGILPFEICIDTKKRNGILSNSLIQKIDQVETTLGQFPEFSSPLSLNQALKFSTQAFYNGDPSQYRIPSSSERAFILSYISAGKSGTNLMKTFIDSNKSITHIAFQVEDMGSKKMNQLLKKVKPKIDSLFSDSKFEVKITGASIIFLKGNNYLVANLYESLAIAFFLISIIMWLLFRTPTMIAISLLPNIIPLLMTAGIMGHFGINLKPSTILIFSIAFGLASDQTIYFLSKYRQELINKNWSISKTVSISLHETGRSMIYTAIILFFGFGIFTVSTFGGTVALGILVSLTLLFALISNLIFLPCLLLSLENRIKRKSFEDPLITIYDEEEEINLDELKVKGTE